MIIIAMAILSLGTYVGATSTNIDTPTSDTTISGDSDLEINWSSFQSHSDPEDEIIESNVTINDDETEIYELDSSTITIEYESELSRTITIPSERISNLESGTWTIQVHDKWDEHSDTTDSVIIEVKDDKEQNENANFSIQSITSNSPVVVGNSLEINVVIDNEGSKEATQEITLSSAISGQETTTETLEPGEQREISFQLDTSQEDEGAHTINILTENDTKTSDIQVDPATESGIVVNEITSPESNTVKKTRQDIDINWTAINEYSQNVTLEYSTVRIRGDHGRSFSYDIERLKDVGANQQKSFETTVDEVNTTHLEAGTWTIEVIDYWGNGDQAMSNKSIEVSEEVKEVSTTIDIPENREINIDEDDRQLEVEYTVVNDNIDQEIRNDLTLTDNTGERTITTQDLEFTPNETRSLSYKFNDNQLTSLNIPGTWTLSIDTRGTSSNSQDTDSISFEVSEEPTSGVQLSITNVQDSSTINIQDDNREIKPNLAIENIGASGSLSVDLDLSDGTETATKSFDSSFNEDEQKELMQTFTHDELSDFDTSKDWTLTGSVEKDGYSDTVEKTFSIDVVEDENDTTDFEESADTSDDENNETDGTSSSVEVSVDTDTEQGIDPDDRELDVSYSITNNGPAQTHDITIEVSDGTLTAEKTVERDFQADETRDITDTFTHDTLKALNMDEDWDISVTASGTQSGSGEDSQSLRPQTPGQVQDDQNNDGETVVTGDNDETLPLLPILVVVLVALVAGIVFVYRQQQ